MASHVRAVFAAAPLRPRRQPVGCRTLPRRGDLCGFETTFTVKRSDFGMTYMPDMLGDEVRIMIGIEGQKK